MQVNPLGAFVDKVHELTRSGNFVELVKFVRGIPENVDVKQVVNSPSLACPFEESALHSAAYMGYIQIARFLLEVGADPFSTVSKYNSTPLHSAAAGGHYEMVQMILQTGKVLKKEYPINHQTSTGWTALHCCLVRKYIEIAKLLVSRGANLDIQNSKAMSCRDLYYEIVLNQKVNSNNNKLMGNNNNNNNNNILGGNIKLKEDTVTIQIASDIHLEFYGTKTCNFSDIITPSAPILALLGDIGIPLNSDNIYADFLHCMSSQFELVLVIAGNHEYYCKRNEQRSFLEVKERIQSICNALPNVIFMDKTSILVNNVRILGTTLWSYIPPWARDICNMSLNDFNLIYLPNPNEEGSLMRLTSTLSTDWFWDEVQWLNEELKASMERHESSVVVLTHHTPSLYLTSSPQYTTQPWLHYPNLQPTDRSWVNTCFMSDLEFLFRNYDPRYEIAYNHDVKLALKRSSPSLPPFPQNTEILPEPSSNLKVWAYGHTHYNNDQIVFGTRLISNQRGYIPSIIRDATPYSPTLSFTV